MRKKYDESQLRPAQRLAAELLVENEFENVRTRKTKEQIAEEVGVTRMTLYRWETQDENFIAYYQDLAQRYIDGKMAFVYKKLIDSIRNGSVKGIELYLKQAGKLVDKQEVEYTDSTESPEDRRKRLEERLRELGIDKDKN